MRPVRIAFTALLLAALLASAAPTASGAALAGPWGGRIEAADLRLIADQRPLGAVLRSIAKRYPGRALDARQIERDGRALYQIKWLGDDGKVRDITADARTGQILQVR
jgi:uncharacterized membrane protein YkoI